MNKILKTFFLLSLFVRLNGDQPWIPGFNFADVEIDKSGSIVRDPIVNQFAAYQASENDFMSENDLKAFVKQQQKKEFFSGDQRELLEGQNLVKSSVQKDSDLDHQTVKYDRELNDNREKTTLISEYQQFFMKILAFFTRK